MRLRVCSEPGCPELTDKTRCVGCRNRAEKARGTRQARGYDKDYDRHRKRAEREVLAGRAICWCCHQPIDPDAKWHDGHCENDRSMIHGPECAGCNLRHIGKPCPHESHARTAA